MENKHTKKKYVEKDNRGKEDYQCYLNLNQPLNSFHGSF